MSETNARSASHGSVNCAGADDLATMQADFPSYRFWRESARNRTRYVARTRFGGENPHTVVTSDLAELRAVLDDSRTGPSPTPASSAEQSELTR